MSVSHSPHGTMRSICDKNSFFFVRTCANSSLRPDRLTCLSMPIFYHTCLYFASFLCGIALEPVGLHGEIIMDYSIHDAIAAGFNKIVFVIRKDIESDFKERIGNRIEKICAQCGVETAYAFQDLNEVPGIVPEGRSKPWGTGQAVLAARDMIAEPFLVINADDYYGKEAYQKMHAWLCEEHATNAYSMAGFVLKNTLSENGGVTRGVCKVEAGQLLDVVETSNIVKTKNGAEVNGTSIDPESYVSMNMWGLSVEFMDVLA